MKTLVLLQAVLAMTLAGCINVDSGAFRGLGGCVYGGVRYSDGSQICQEGQRMTCQEGRWIATGAPCS